MADVKRVYTFGNKEAEGNGKMRELLGGKGANLAEMNLIGIPLVDLFLYQLEYVVIVCARKAFVRGYHDIPDLLVFRLNLRPRIEIRVLYLRCMPDNSGNGPLELKKIIGELKL